MNIVMTLKEDRLNIRIRPDIKEDLRITAEIRGLSISGLIHHLIVKAIREEKERDPKAFENLAIEGKELAPKSKKKIPLIKNGDETAEKAA